MGRKRNTRNKASAQAQAGIAAETVRDGANCGQVPQVAAEGAVPGRAASVSEGIQPAGLSTTTATRDHQELGQSGEGAVCCLLEREFAQVDLKAVAGEEESWIKTDDDRRVYGGYA
jgi:hypothetical protein